MKLEITTNSDGCSFEIGRADRHSNIEPTVKIMLGQTIRSIKPVMRGEETEELHIITDQNVYVMFHKQDCCESVWLEDIAGDLEDLIGAPLLQAEMVTNSGEPEGEPTPPLNEDEESFTWTFYKFATIKGSVTLRWYGRSNGYYSEKVTFVELFPEEVGEVGQWLDTQTRGFCVDSPWDWEKFNLNFNQSEDAFHFKMKWV